MTDSNDNKPPENNENDSKASHDLSEAVEEALRMMRENQAQDDTSSDDASSQSALPSINEDEDSGTRPVTATDEHQAVIENDVPATSETDDADADAIAPSATSEDAIISSSPDDQNAGEGNDDPMSDNSKKATSTTDAVEGDNGNTTNDLQQEAYKAMQRESERKREAEQKASSAVTERSTFTTDMRLKLESGESGHPIIKAVTEELIVGRADNVTDYVPDIDLTPHGAYRLGLSRRHAVILRDKDRVLVRDLNSRNGTFVNGAIVPGGGTQVIRDGDEVRFGNLAMRVSFVSE